MKATLLPGTTPPSPVDHAQVAARLTDMRKTLAEEDFQAFLDSASTELHDLARHDQAWSPPLVDRAIAAAMVLGFDSLETACRKIAELDSAREEEAARARVAARTAATILDAFRAQSRR